MTPPARPLGGGLTDSRVIRRASLSADAPAVAVSWPLTVPAVAALRDGLEFRPGVTFLVGENGSGKSTVLEGIAEAYGFPAEGGTRNGGAVTRRSESPLGEWLTLERGVGAPRWGFFLRAETMHGHFSYLGGMPGSPDGDLHEMSHGESFLALLDRKIDSPGFFCLDEPVPVDAPLPRAAGCAGEGRGADRVRHALARAGLAARGDGARVRGVGHPRDRVGGARARRALAELPAGAGPVPAAPARLSHGARGGAREARRRHG
jgi:hypothetical protein